MATIYKIEIEMVSPWINYDEETVKKILEELIEARNKENSNKFESIEIKVERE